MLHTPVMIIDLVLVYVFTYSFLLWVRNTHVYNLAKGMIVIVAFYIVSNLMGLTTINWILEKLFAVLVLLILIIFQPELRRFLDRLGTGQMFTTLFVRADGKTAVIIRRLLMAVEHMAKSKTGALIVIEVGSNLSQYIESGIQINADISTELLVCLFNSTAPTHDGAVIIQENKIAAAGCLLPLTDKHLSDKRMGTRHRSAVALSDRTDAVIIVVSEEDGIISLAERGTITRYLTRQALETRLFNLYREEDRHSKWYVKQTMRTILSKLRLSKTHV